MYVYLCIHICVYVCVCVCVCVYSTEAKKEKLEWKDVFEVDLQMCIDRYRYMFICLFVCI